MSQRISQDTIDKITTAARIVDVIGEFVALRRKGVNYVGCCPFHDEKTASFTVSPVKGIFSCFGCGKAGDVVKFVQEHEVLSYPEALRWLGVKYHITVEQHELTPEEKIKSEKREALKIANEWAAQQWAADLSKANAYIKERGISPEIVKSFRLGYAVDDWNNLLTGAKLKQFKEQVFIEASLAGRTDKGIFDWFRNRLMFPFMDLSGNIIGFTGRTLSNSKQEAKYLNSSDTEIFKKGQVLFGLFQAKKAISKEDKCYLVEGNIDVTTFHQNKIENTVCGSGTALTIDQIKLIKRFTNNVTVIYDGDAAGIKASFKNIDLMLAAGVNVRAIALPTGEDPDSFARKMKPKELEKFLEDNEKDFINFKYELLQVEIEKDPMKESEFLCSIMASIAVMPDEIMQGIYRKQCREKFKIDEKLIEKAFSKKPSKAKEPERIGWIGLDIVIDKIKSENEVFLTSSIDSMYKAWTAAKDEESNTISWKGSAAYIPLQELKKLTNNIIIIDAIGRIYDENDNVTPLIAFCKRLFEFGFNVKISSPGGDYYGDYDSISFLQYYFDKIRDYISINEFDSEKKNQAIEDAAELFSQADNTTQNVNCKSYGSKLGLKEADFKKVMKPFLEKRKTRSAMQTEMVDEGEKMHFDPDRLPEYVDQTFYQKNGYFPYQNKKGEKVRYVFRTQSGGMEVIGNFYIEPLFHVYNKERGANKRIIKVNNAEQNRSFFLELKSDEMADFASFKRALFNEGGNWFTKGKANHYDSIMASISCQFPICYEFSTFGQQPEGFWAFGNAIFSDGKITYIDEYGRAEYNGTIYYSPAFSKINSGTRQGNDKYENDKFFIYMENKDSNFAEWASLMNDVYIMNHNGKWATLFAIMAGFRSVIYPIDRLFTSLFLIGPTESGKSQIAISIRSLFMKYDAPLFNLNSGTDAAFFTTLERFCDVPVVYEEYNDNQISPIKFQGLKAAVYDGEGKQKKKDATSKDLDISKVTAAPVILGQESPEQDDCSLANRCVLLHVPKKDDWTENETANFQLLKDKEKKGLSNVLLEVLKQRDIVKNNFQRIQRAEFKRLKDDLSKSGSSYQTRILNTVSLFAAMCKLWEELIPTLKLPFTYEEFYQIAKAHIIKQSEAIMSTNRLAVFFDTLELLLNRPYNGLTPGKEYKIEMLSTVKVMKNRTETEDIALAPGTKVLFLRLNILHPMYADVRKVEALKLNNLMNYLKDHPAYIGSVKSTRFEWQEIHKQFDPVEARVKDMSREASANTSAVALKYEMLELDLEKFTEAGIKVDYTPRPSEDGQQQLPLTGDVEDDVPF